MKIQNIITLVTLATTLVACNKNHQDTGKNNFGKDVNYTSQEDLVKDAKKAPLTTIALSENIHDFGIIKKGEKLQNTYELTNTGSVPLVISAVKPGCGCTVAEYTKDPIKPGDKGKVTLKFDSSNFEGIVNKFAEIYANTTKTPIVINFTANIKK